MYAMDKLTFVEVYVKSYDCREISLQKLTSKVTSIQINFKDNLNSTSTFLHKPKSYTILVNYLSDIQPLKLRE
jgi:hypothetical protein